MFISFAWTLAPVLAGVKTFTWREWAHTHARKYTTGDQVTAYDKLPRSGGHPVAIVVITKPPVYRSTHTLADSDWEAEGFKWLIDHPEAHPIQLFGKPFDPSMLSFQAFCERRARREMGWDVRFELVEVL